MGLIQRVQSIVRWVMELKPVRVFLHYASARGFVLSAGLSYQAIFSVFAGIWVAFAIAGFAIAGNRDLQDALIGVLNEQVPGLIDEGDGSGAVSRDLLEQAGILGWTGAFAAVGLLFTALGWLAAGRDAVRTMFGLPGPYTNFLLLKLKDLGLAIGFGLAVLASAVLSLLSTAALQSVFDAVGIEEESLAAVIGARAVGLLVVLLLDTIVLALFFRVVSGIPIPIRMLAQGTIIGAVALGALKALGGVLLGGATSNPLLAGFAVIIGLLIWFNLVCQVILLSAAWIAVSAQDADLDLRGRRRERAAPTGTAAAL